MKSITKLTLMATLLFGSLSFVACSDDDGDSNGGGGTPSGEYVSAKVNGNAFSSSTLFDAVGANHPNASTLVVQGSDNSGKAIQIMLMNFDGEGSYNVSNMQNGQALYTQASPFVSYSSAAGNGATGTVEITLVDDAKVEGTFSFTGKNPNDNTQSVTVTEGSFRANFQ
jgi:hypothetical protein